MNDQEDAENDRDRRETDALQREGEGEALAEVVKQIAEHGPEWAQEALEAIDGDVNALDGEDLDDPKSNGETMAPPSWLLWLVDPWINVSRQRRCHVWSAGRRFLLLQTVMHELIHVYFLYHADEFGQDYGNEDHEAVTLPSDDGSTIEYVDHYEAATGEAEKTVKSSESHAKGGG